MSLCEKVWRTLEPFHQDWEALGAAELSCCSKIQPKFLLNEALCVQPPWPHIHPATTQRSGCTGPLFSRATGL